MCSFESQWEMWQLLACHHCNQLSTYNAPSTPLHSTPLTASSSISITIPAIYLLPSISHLSYHTMAPSSSSSSSSSSHSVSTVDSSCPDLSAALHEAIHTNPPMFSSPGFAGSSRHPRQQHIPDYTRSGTAGTPPPYIVDETAPLRPLGDRYVAACCVCVCVCVCV
jgi:hypothetical protein